VKSWFFEPPREMKIGLNNRTVWEIRVKLQCWTEEREQLLVRVIRRFENMRFREIRIPLYFNIIRAIYQLQLGTDGQYVHLLPSRLLFLPTQELIFLLWLTVNKNSNLLWLYCYSVKPTHIIHNDFQPFDMIYKVPHPCMR